MGFARSICQHEKIAEATKAIQEELFTVSASLASPEGDKKTNRVTHWSEVVFLLSQYQAGLPRPLACVLACRMEW